MHSGYLNDGVAEAQHQRHSYRMTEEGGSRREVTAKTQPDITQSVRAVISELIFVIIMGQCTGPVLIQLLPVGHQWHVNCSVKIPVF